MKPSARPTLSDVARLSGVSPATVSRALSRPALVEEGTLGRVRSAAATLGYVPAGAARALASGRSMTVGAIVPTLDSAIFARALQALQATLADAGYQMLVASHDYNPAVEAAALRAFLTRGIDALALVGAHRSEEALRLIERTSLPVVVTWSFDPRLPSVGVDNREAGRLAAEHLLTLGHRRIGIVSGVLRHNDRARLRLEGVRAALESAGLDLPDWRVSEQPLTLSGGRAGCAALLSLAEPPTALVGGIDLLAAGALLEAQTRGLKVPERLSIVGIDNLELSGHLSPGLTTVHIPTAQIGETAARHLLARLRREAIPTRTELPVALVLRRSAGPPA